MLFRKSDDSYHWESEFYYPDELGNHVENVVGNAVNMSMWPKGIETAIDSYSNLNLTKKLIRYLPNKLETYSDQIIFTDELSPVEGYRLDSRKLVSKNNLVRVLYVSSLLCLFLVSSSIFSRYLPFKAVRIEKSFPSVSKTSLGCWSWYQAVFINTRKTRQNSSSVLFSTRLNLDKVLGI